MADKMASKSGDRYIASEQGLLALVLNKSGVRVLLQKAVLTAAVNTLRDGDQVNSQNAEDEHQSLDRYTANLTQRAQAGKLDPVIGRDGKIRRAIQVLQRRTKNNPVMIGEPDVGKKPLSTVWHSVSLMAK